MEVSASASPAAVNTAAVGAAAAGGTPVGGGARAGTSTSSSSVRQRRLGGADSQSLYRFLTTSDRDLIEYATGEDLDADPEERGRSLSSFAAHIARDREASRLKPNQELTARYLWEASRQYVEAGMEESNPFSGKIMERALAYLSANSAGLCDVTV